MWPLSFKLLDTGRELVTRAYHFLTEMNGKKYFSLLYGVKQNSLVVFVLGRNVYKGALMG